MNNIDIEKFRKDTCSYIDYMATSAHGKKKALYFVKKYVSYYSDHNSMNDNAPFLSELLPYEKSIEENKDTEMLQGKQGYWIVKVDDIHTPIYNNQTKSYDDKHITTVGNVCRCSICKNNFIGDLVTYNPSFCLTVDKLPDYCGCCGAKMNGYKNLEDIVIDRDDEDDDDDYTEYD